MRGYGQYCPVALAAEVFAERWTPIIIRNLHLGCGRFTDILDGAPGLRRSVLAQRLRALERAGVGPHADGGVDADRERRGTGRGVPRTRCVGRALAHRPARGPGPVPRAVDAGPADRPGVAVPAADRGALPGHRAPAAEPVLAGRSPRTGNEVCAQEPGFAEDGQVETDTVHLVRWYASEISLGAALRDGGMTVTAPRWLERELAGWGRLNPYAVRA